MSVNSHYYLGFDPGGVGKFGWAIAMGPAFETPRLIETGLADNAQHAIDTVQGSLPTNVTPTSAGIDAPLYWTPTGARCADETVRRELRARGAPSPGGTVQHLNSLRGACLVQGVTFAILLRLRYPTIPITETHPKALLWHLGLASRDRPARDVPLSAITDILRSNERTLSEHERDAALSCAAAVAFHEKRTGWRDLVATEKYPLCLIPNGVAYWMPEP